MDFIPVCPEVECGMGIPRETLRLVGNPENPRLITSKSKIDHTDQMVTYARDRVKKLEEEDLCGFIFKSKSPSSGMMRVKVYTEKGYPSNRGVGIFAGIFMKHFPLIPVEEEGRLNDPKIRENFIEQIFTLKRWRDTLKCQKSIANLVDFHTRNKLLILSHSQKIYRKMGPIVASAKEHSLEVVFQRYEQNLMDALRLKTSPSKNTNVMLHCLGFFKKALSGDEKQELLEHIDSYRKEEIPLIVPVTLFRHYVRKYDQPYLKCQTYFNPHPTALKLRNHA